MIPTQPTEAMRGAYVGNIIRTWQSATAEQMQRGRGWYQAAHDVAAMIAPDARTGAGVLAALSAQKSWTENTRLATQACAGTPGGHVANALGKAVAILAGVDPAEVLPMALKTGMFFRCIADPADPYAVVIDRHAHDVAVGEVYGSRGRGLSNVNRYTSLAACYRDAAERLGELPSTVQAVTWVVQTDALKAARARRGSAS